MRLQEALDEVARLEDRSPYGHPPPGNIHHVAMREEHGHQYIVLADFEEAYGLEFIITDSGRLEFYQALALTQDCYDWQVKTMVIKNGVVCKQL
jgi:hypothetical protein